MSLVLLTVALISGKACVGEVTDKQYASMPLLFHQDNYDKCMLLEDEALYCSITYELEPLNSSNPSEMWNIIKEVSSSIYNYRHDHLRHGICVPFTCPNVSRENEISLRNGIKKCYDKKFYDLGLKGTITKVSCETNEDKYPVDYFDIVVGVLLLFYLVLVMFSTFYEYSARFKDPTDYQRLTNTSWGKFFIAFSITKNWERLTNVRVTEDTKKLRCLQGVRIYNNVIVLLAHTILYRIAMPIANTKYTETANDQISNLFMSSGSLSVSTNFFMSSFLLCYGLLSQFEDKKEIKPKYLIWIFISRYLRLTPTLFAVSMLHATWLRHLGRGPNWNQVINEDFLRCRKNWWTNILYLNNVIDEEHMCHPHTWYLALDTQYFVLLLIIVMFMKKYPRMVWPILGFLWSIIILGTFVQNYLFGFPPLLIPTPEKIYDFKFVLPNQQWHNQFKAFTGCAAGPIIGLAFGYIFFRNKNKDLYKENYIFHQVLHYIIGYGIPLGIVLIPGYFVLIRRVQLNIFWASLYVALSKTIFVMSVGYGLFTTMCGLRTITKYVLEFRPLYILGRLSYTAYLFHMTIMAYNSAIVRSPIFISNYSIIYALFGDLSFTYTVALLITLFLEMPMSALQKIVMPSKSEESTNKAKEQ